MRRAAIVAGVAGLLLACSSRQQPVSNATTAKDVGFFCAANVGGARFEADDIPGGASLKMLTTTRPKVAAMRTFARERLEQQQARASGGVPTGQFAELPPVMTQVFDYEGGSLVRYTAIDPADTRRVRDLVRWDAEMQNKGYCSRLRPPPQAGPVGVAAAQGGPPAAQGESRPEPFALSITGVEVDQPLIDQCGIKGTSAFFAFDSFDLRPNAYPLLNGIAACLTEGALAGGGVQVVGHADPRGTDEYNQKLGKDRAQSVADFLISAGVPRDRIEVISQGEEAATSDPRQWPSQRRVEIRRAP